MKIGNVKNDFRRKRKRQRKTNGKTGKLPIKPKQGKKLKSGRTNGRQAETNPPEKSEETEVKVKSKTNEQTQDKQSRQIQKSQGKESKNQDETPDRNHEQTMQIMSPKEARGQK